MSLVITDEKREAYINVTAESTWAILCIDPARQPSDRVGEEGCVRLFVDGKKYCLGDNRSYEQQKKEVQWLMDKMANGIEGSFVFTNENALERCATLPNIMGELTTAVNKKVADCIERDQKIRFSLHIYYEGLNPERKSYVGRKSS